MSWHVFDVMASSYFDFVTNVLTSWRTFLTFDVFWRYDVFIDVITCFLRHDKLFDDMAKVLMLCTFNVMTHFLRLWHQISAYKSRHHQQRMSFLSKLKQRLSNVKSTVKPQGHMPQQRRKRLNFEGAYIYITFKIYYRYIMPLAVAAQRKNPPTFVQDDSICCWDTVQNFAEEKMASNYQKWQKFPNTKQPNNDVISKLRRIDRPLFEMTL